ncbi:MAG: YqeG family HAD IIIA-type phosphatase [Firmicutes bacterium]|nr:YqeG family HAD IIIA-type phosphatase [Bacillota bacterium]
MLRLLYPRLWVSSVCRIEASHLRRQGIRGLILDVDNTLVPWAGTEMAPATRCWLEGLSRAGFGVCLVSNGRGRAELLAASTGFPVIWRAAKPLPRAFVRAMGLLGTRPPETAVVGDQIFTDILGGNLTGAYTVLVSPLSGREFFTTRLNRQAEKLVLWHLRRMGLGPDAHLKSEGTVDDA